MKISILLLLVVKISSCEISIPYSTGEDNCFQKLVERNLNPNDYTVVVLDGFESDFILKPVKYKAVYSITRGSKIKNLPLFKAQAYAINLHSSTMVRMINYLASLRNWNPRAKWLIVTKQNVTEIFETSYKYFIFNLAVIKKSETNESLDLYNWSEVQKGCDKPFIVKSQGCTISLFRKNKKKSWTNCPIHVAAMPKSIYVFTNKKRPYNLDGVDIRMLEAIEKQMGFRKVYVNHSIGTWGVKSKGRYDGIYEEIQNNKADLVMGMCPGNYTVVWDFDATHYYWMDAVSWVVPTAGVIPPTLTLVRIYPGIIWLLICIMLLVTPVLWFITSRILSGYEINSFQNLQICYLRTLSLHLAISSPSCPISTTMRILFIIWSIITLILITLFQSKLISVLTQPQYESQISNTEELLNSGLKLGLVTSLHTFFDRQIKTEAQILKEATPCDLSLTCANRTAFKRDFAFQTGRVSIDYYILRYFTAPDDTSRVFKFTKELFYSFPLHIVFSTGNPLYEDFNNVVKWIPDSGLIWYWYNGIRADTSRTFYREQKEMIDYNDSRVLSKKDLITPFILLFIGLICSSIAFGLELMHKKYKNIKTEKYKKSINLDVDS